MNCREYQNDVNKPLVDNVLAQQHKKKKKTRLGLLGDIYVYTLYSSGTLGFWHLPAHIIIPISKWHFWARFSNAQQSLLAFGHKFALRNHSGADIWVKDFHRIQGRLSWFAQWCHEAPSSGNKCQWKKGRHLCPQPQTSQLEKNLRQGQVQQTPLPQSRWQKWGWVRSDFL